MNVKLYISDFRGMPYVIPFSSKDEAHRYVRHSSTFHGAKHDAIRKIAWTDSLGNELTAPISTWNEALSIMEEL